MRRFLGVNLGVAVFMAALAAGQQPQPQVRTGIGAPNQPANQQPQVRSGIGAQNPAYRPPAPGVVRQSQRPSPTSPQPSTVPPRPGVVPQPQPAATPAPTPAPTPVSLQPIRPSDMPPVPPQVTYRDGMLTVQAVNSTLSSLLQAIRNITGIQFEGAETSGERVAISSGPAPEGEVLASIFNGSGYDYVVVGRPDNPAIVQRVILTPKARAGGMPAAFSPPPQRPQAAEPDEEAPDEQVETDQPQDTPAQPPQPPATAQEQPQGTPKTPEQLLQELKEMQQQQQGQQPPPPNQIPRKQPPQ